MILVALVLAAVAPVDAATDPAAAELVAAFRKATFPNAAATLRVTTSFPGSLPRSLEQHVWCARKKCRVRQAGSKIDMYLDGAAGTLVVRDPARQEAVRFRLDDTAGQKIARQAAGPLLSLPKLAAGAKGRTQDPRTGLVIESEVVRLEPGKARAADLAPPRGVKIVDAEELVVPPPPTDPTELGGPRPDGR